MSRLLFFGLRRSFISYSRKLKTKAVISKSSHFRHCLSTSLALFFSLLSLVATAQVSKQFSQYVFSGLTTNPAYAGYKQDWNLNSVYRQQWAGVPGSPTTTSITLDGLTNITNERMAVGLELSSEKLGAQGTTDIYGSYAYRLPLNEEGTSRLCFGLAMGISQYSINGTMFKAVDAGDQSVPLNKVSAIIPDARFGLYYYTPSFYLGGSFLGLFSLSGAKQYSQGTNTFYGTVKGGHQVYITSGTIINCTETIKLKPSVMLSDDFTGNTNVDLNVFLLMNERLWVGTSYRNGLRIFRKSGSGLEAVNSMSTMIEFYVTDNLRIGYAYDFTTNGISGYQSGSHELSLGLTFHRTRSPGIICPHYF